MKTIKKTKAIEHPMEAVLDLDPGTTIVEYTEMLPAEVVKMPEYDAKDEEIEEKIEEVYSTAMGNVATVSDAMDLVEGKYKARIGEVTAAMLNVALGAVREKRELKKHKDQVSTISAGEGGAKTVNNNLIVADRNEILRILADRKA
ncbi:hypothetical protein E4H12_15395 [Candidatus Thorarchaeota archaeon]|nr:MAG: hypothetical protein E4H12_15395 [Candidatus Thorarchaeota archaeon]